MKLIDTVVKVDQTGDISCTTTTTVQYEFDNVDEFIKWDTYVSDPTGSGSSPITKELVH